MHRLVEEAGSRSVAEILGEFDHEVEAAPAGSRYPAIADAVPGWVIEEKRNTLEGWLRRYGGPEGPLPSPEQQGAAFAAGHERPLRGEEKWLESLDLRLGGKADLIRDAGGGVVEIVDFKSGAVKDPDGQLKWSYQLQLQAYGLMLLESEPDIELRLVVDNGREHRVDSTHDALLSAKSEITERLRGLPPAGEVATAGLAQPGEACWGCPIRPSCSVYQDQAPTWWSGGDGPSMLPNDTWGEVTSVENLGDRMELYLRDDAGRLVRIQGLGRDRLDSELPESGDHVWLFDLMAVPSRRIGYSGERLHPRSMRDQPHPLDQRAFRSWTTEVFLLKSAEAK